MIINRFEMSCIWIRSISRISEYSTFSNVLTTFDASNSTAYTDSVSGCTHQGVVTVYMYALILAQPLSLTTGSNHKVFSFFECFVMHSRPDCLNCVEDENVTPLCMQPPVLFTVLVVTCTCGLIIKKKFKKSESEDIPVSA